MIERAYPIPGDPRYGCYQADARTPKRAYLTRKEAKARMVKGQSVYLCMQHGEGAVWHIGGRRKRRAPDDS